MLKTLSRWLPLVIVISLAWLAVSRTQDIRDWFALRDYTPSPVIAGLAQDTNMSEEGRRLFYVSHPELNDRESFNTNCPFPDRSLVLGCYSQQQIYIFNVDDPRLSGVEEVTAAHEMLHAVYDRFAEDERAKIDRLVMEAYRTLDDERLNETIAQYEASDPASVPNELHSILGTEHRQLPAELEAHYARYFNSRDAVLAISESYEKVFVGLQNDIERLDKQIGGLKDQIGTLEGSLETRSQALSKESDRLDALLAADNIPAYNAAVPGYNANVASFNATIEEYQAKVKLHNDLVDKRNNIAVEQNSLVHSLDSKFSPIVND